MIKALTKGSLPLCSLPRACSLRRVPVLSSPSLPVGSSRPAKLRGGAPQHRGIRRGAFASMAGSVTSTPSTPKDLDLPTPLVEPSWLAEHLAQVKVLDASWYMPAEKRKPVDEFHSKRIPGSVFFDIDAVCDPTTDLPHMLPTPEAFSAAASALGLRDSDKIVVYDGKGLFSAARAWWMFRVFGHEDVAVLDGGLPAWVALGLPVDTTPSPEAQSASKLAAASIQAAYDDPEVFREGSKLPFHSSLQQNLLLLKDQVLENIEKGDYQLLDARSPGRFKGQDPEPRKGVRGGHVPGSVNVPFPKVLGGEGSLLPPEELEAAFKDAGVGLGEKPVATMCGTGVTGAILSLALFRLGHKGAALYDGSWTEWGSRPDTPIA